MPERVAAILLAAGRSSRTAPHDKLLARYGGQAQLRRIAGVALASGACPVIVVLGHDAARRAEALAGLDVEILVNPDHALGLSSSVQAGFAAAHARCEGVMMVPADQPLIDAGHLERLLAAFRPGHAVVATDGGALRSPAILPIGMAAEIASLSGDRGAGRLLAAHPRLIPVEIGPPASTDIDDVAAIVATGGCLPEKVSQG